ncbi:MAG: hypothetical protein PHV11_06500 [Candidatus Bipolaricaulis sp.]|nr:hypothetical protein [Candidatus Bipolaricaulis sp.]
MARLWKRVLLRLGLIALLVATGCSSIITVDVTGGWVGTLTWTDGPAANITYPLSFDLAQEDKDLSGRVTLTSHGTETYTIDITQGRAHGSSVEFTASGVNDKVPTPVDVVFVFDGTADSDTLSGTGTAEIGGDLYEFAWAVTLVAPPPAES